LAFLASKAAAAAAYSRAFFSASFFLYAS